MTTPNCARPAGDRGYHRILRLLGKRTDEGPDPEIHDIPPPTDCRSQKVLLRIFPPSRVLANHINKKCSSASSTAQEQMGQPPQG